MAPAPLANATPAGADVSGGLRRLLPRLLPAGGDGHRHVLVDCGVHPRATSAPSSGVFDDIAEVDAAGSWPLVVATHEHADHISGFGALRAELREVRGRRGVDAVGHESRDPQAAALRRSASLVDTLGALRGSGARSSEERAAEPEPRHNDDAVAGCAPASRGGAQGALFPGGRQPEPPEGLPGLRRGCSALRTTEFLRRWIRPPSSATCA